jgi:hypothetical protein
VNARRSSLGAPSASEKYAPRGLAPIDGLESQELPVIDEILVEFERQVERHPIKQNPVYHLPRQAGEREDRLRFP